MKPNNKNSFLLPALIAVLNFLPAGRVTAQIFTTLHSFNHDDGPNPSGLIISGNTLYGTTYSGGSSDAGTVFAVHTDGTGFTNLYCFTATYGDDPSTNSDGTGPVGGLILSGNTLYGTAVYGGSAGNGTVFAVNTDGAGLTNLHNFTATQTNSLGLYTNSDGATPPGGLILSGNTLYGTAGHGGSSGHGTAFKVNADGTGFTTLHSFTVTSGNPYFTNSDGAGPVGGLILSSNMLYGTAGHGGSSGQGTVFAINTNGTGFKNLHSFTGYPSDGANPYAELILSGNTLYGTASGGGSSGQGTVFAVNTDGTGYTILHSFTALSAPYSGTNSDGALPRSVIVSGNTLYGTAQSGGSSGFGTVFAVNTDGTGFTTLYSFTYGSDGAYPSARLILSGNTLYGTAGQGGSANNGTVFSLSFRPQLTIAPSGPYLILTWPANVAGFDYTGYRLQKANAITGPFANVPGSSSPYFIPITSPQQFFRLRQ